LKQGIFKQKVYFNNFTNFQKDKILAGAKIANVKKGSMLMLV
jgi:hypothetical protein